MYYMLLIYGAEDAWTNDEREACVAKSKEVLGELVSRGRFAEASPLQSVTKATTVRVREGRTLVTDGPFAETTEQLGGYYLLDLADLDEAIAVASKLPPAERGTVEIRPVMHLPGLPERKRLPYPRPVNLTPYLILCYDNEQAWATAGEAALRDAMRDAVGITRELAEQGKFLDSAPLHPPATATSVRIRSGRREITDGPFAETREVLGGFYLILAESREFALGIAARHPGARVGAVEVRPLDLTALDGAN